jgi:hypothetical protein
MPQFRIVLDDVDLDERQRESLDRALQKTTLQFLADHDTRGDRVAYYIPRILRPPLAGIWIKKLDEGVVERANELTGIRDNLDSLNKEIEGGAGV